MHVRGAQGRTGGPIGVPALLGLTAQALDHLSGVAPMVGRQFAGQGGLFFLGGLGGENAALDQGAEAVIGNLARFLEHLQQLAQLAIDHQPQLADRMQHQHPISADRQKVHEAGQAQEHRATQFDGDRV